MFKCDDCGKQTEVGEKSHKVMIPREKEYENIRIVFDKETKRKKKEKYYTNGFEAAGENPSEQGLANGQGVGLGNTPPGLENGPPGLHKKQEDYIYDEGFSPDDEFELPDVDDESQESTEDEIEPGAHGRAKAAAAKAAGQAKGKASSESGKANKPEDTPGGGPPGGGPPGGGPPEGKGPP